MAIKVRALEENESVTFKRLHQPGGAIGGVSVAATLTLATYGVLGFASIVLAMTTDSDLWQHQGDRVLGSILFGLMIAGAVGFLIMDRHPSLGVALAILGSIGVAIPGFWTLVPIVLGIVFAVAAVKRANWMREHPARA